MVRSLGRLNFRRLLAAMTLAAVIVMATFAACSALMPSASLAQESSGNEDSVNEAGEENDEDDSGNTDNEASADDQGSEDSANEESDGGSEEGQGRDNEPTGDAEVGLDDNGEPQQPGADDGPTGDATAGEENTPNGEVVEDGNGSGDDSEGSNDEGGNDEGGNDDSEGGFLTGIAVDMVGAILSRLGEGVEEAGDRRAEDLSSQITDGRYMLEPPSNALTEIYEDFANFVKPIAIVLFLFLGLSMALRGANHDTAYAAQTGIPKIVTVLAGIAFMPEIIGVIADLTREISNAVIDEQAMQEGFTRLEDGKDFRQWIGFSGPVGDGIFSVIKFILGVLILLAIAVRNLVFGLLYVIGPLAIGLYGFPQFADVAGAWFRGILACFVISILWALEFGIGYRFVAQPGLLTGSGAWPVLPTLFSIGILWLVWKTPWWVFQWAFYSYSAGGGGGGMRGAMTAVSLFKLFRPK